MATNRPDTLGIIIMDVLLLLQMYYYHYRCIIIIMDVLLLLWMYYYLIVDPALMRPGRLDRKVEFSLPDLEGRT